MSLIKGMPASFPSVFAHTCYWQRGPWTAGTDVSLHFISNPSCKASVQCCAVVYILCSILKFQSISNHCYYEFQKRLRPFIQIVNRFFIQDDSLLFSVGQVGSRSCQLGFRRRTGGKRVEDEEDDATRPKNVHEKLKRTKTFSYHPNLTETASLSACVHCSLSFTINFSDHILFTCYQNVISECA